jgi:dTDP-4-amino-4,6-dideoxygalactose transaminase
MLTAISRYGVRAHPRAQHIVSVCREDGEIIQGREIAAFEQAFAPRPGARDAVTASCGRMAFVREAAVAARV